eukprot:CAMPEP_0198312046 /NCGR_PEP_ID=MMETSP1450-20131203/3576_1 /TAXON_ID=753684 ORGANISM="Madagascaria erythrocladiodes, Strain CCMP3234" /NCGR_SAMPLE_ID=MMETSP1450 /ASSEMBLY_ACC=CAM_ASM_001115 /LENGTH=409 /DNA_ID=CAMNT_0044014971 /DNA_START=144 /DNA_END=1373 /DNA_ORIENTATION=+
MPVETRLYELLSVSPTASQDEIKKAYRKAAIRHHPDKGGDTEKFQEVTHAFEVLSDEQKRSIYDSYGEAALKDDGGHPGGGHAADIFEQMFGGGMGGMFGGMGGAGGRARPRTTEDAVQALRVGLADVYKGKLSKIAVTRKRLCKKCSGSGASAKGKAKTCSGCNGQGIRIVQRMIGPGMVQRFQAECEECDGRGKTIAAGFRCDKCRGAGVNDEKKTLEVYVEKGMRDGQKIVFSGEADEEPDLPPGDVVMVVKIAEHKDFKRKAQHLILEKEVTLAEALCGVSFTIKHLDGRTVHIKSKPGTVIKPNSLMSVMGEGMPVYKRPDEKGFLFIKFDVKFPDSISPDLCGKLDAILGPRSVPIIPDTEEVDEAEMIEFKDYHARESSGNGSAYDEDEDEMGGQRVQCAHQ